MEDAGHLRRLAGLHAEWHDVLDLEVDHLTDPDRVLQAVLANLDRQPLESQVLPDQRSQRLHRTAERSREDGAELLCLLVRRLVVDHDAEAPIPLAHHLRRIADRRDRQPTHVGAVDVAPLHVEDEHDLAAIPRRSE
jgi:hypothetical protein